MARPPKQGIDYFPMDVQDDINIQLFRADTGMIGFAILVKLWQKIYGENGYFCRFDEDVLVLFANEHHLTPTQVKKAIDSALSRGIFDKTLYENEQILTSLDVQERFLSATKKRVSPQISDAYSLVSGVHNPQSKEKKREKESRVYVTPRTQKKTNPPIIRSVFNNYDDPNAEESLRIAEELIARQIDTCSQNSN
ncbi:MAG: DUF4373 domain-containing protein [Clostridia bacterium]|nr:DUF4373 domain-containing protein [Clostridia bacterium]